MLSGDFEQVWPWRWGDDAGAKLASNGSAGWIPHVYESGEPETGWDDWAPRDWV